VRGSQHYGLPDRLLRHVRVFFDRLTLSTAIPAWVRAERIRMGYALELRGERPKVDQRHQLNRELATLAAWPAQSWRGRLN
jgi:hypothetical protein